MNTPEKFCSFFSGPADDAGSKLIKTSLCCCQTTRHYILEVRNLDISHFYMRHIVVSKLLTVIGSYYSYLLISHSYSNISLHALAFNVKVTVLWGVTLCCVSEIWRAYGITWTPQFLITLKMEWVFFSETPVYLQQDAWRRISESS
jgi:hypothetical protein